MPPRRRVSENKRARPWGVSTNVSSALTFLGGGLVATSFITWLRNWLSVRSSSSSPSPAAVTAALSSRLKLSQMLCISWMLSVIPARPLYAAHHDFHLDFHLDHSLYVRSNLSGESRAAELSWPKSCLVLSCLHLVAEGRGVEHQIPGIELIYVA